MQISYTDHAEDRLKERGISKREVREAIHIGKKSDAEEELRRSVIRNKNGSLIVIYKINNPEEVVVVTAYRE